MNTDTSNPLRTLVTRAPFGSFLLLLGTILLVISGAWAALAGREPADAAPHVYPVRWHNPGDPHEKDRPLGTFTCWPFTDRFGGTQMGCARVTDGTGNACLPEPSATDVEYVRCGRGDDNTLDDQ